MGRCAGDGSSQLQTTPCRHRWGGRLGLPATVLSHGVSGVGVGGRQDRAEGRAAGEEHGGQQTRTKRALGWYLGSASPGFRLTQDERGIDPPRGTGLEFRNSGEDGRLRQCLQEPGRWEPQGRAPVNRPHPPGQTQRLATKPLSGSQDSVGGPSPLAWILQGGGWSGGVATASPLVGAQGDGHLARPGGSAHAGPHVAST